jgi:hypothetical protein
VAIPPVRVQAEQLGQPVVLVRVDSVARALVVAPVVLVVVPVGRAALGVVLVVAPVVPVVALVRRVVVVRHAAVVAVVAKKNCSPARFATPSRRLRFPKASSSSSAVCRPRSSRLV